MSEKTNIVKAINKNVRSSPRKLALVLNYIKGKKADLALRDLEFTRKRIAKEKKQQDIKAKYITQSGIEEFIASTEDKQAKQVAQRFVDTLRDRIDKVKEVDDHKVVGVDELHNSIREFIINFFSNFF